MAEPLRASDPIPSPASTAQPILTHEKSLTKKVAKGSEAGDIYDQQVLMLGAQLVTQISILLKMSRLHGRTNAALDNPVDTAVTVIKTLAHDEPISIRLQNDFLFFGQRHLKITAGQMPVFSTVIDMLNHWNIGGISFSNETESRDIREFIFQLARFEASTSSISTLRASLEQNSVKGIALEERRVLRGKATAKTRYANAASAVGKLVQDSREKGKIGFKQAKRAIQSIVDLMMNDEASLLGLTTLRCHDQYTHNHSVNVSLLSMALGNRAGYPKVELADLGLAALFHDLGKTTIPMEVLNKPGDFTDEEWKMMRNHPTEGVLNLTSTRSITNLPGRMTAAAFEHHMNMDLSGYPKLNVTWKLSMTGRILMIADCYDAMTSSRVYRREPISPSKVLRFMFEKAGKSFDSTLMKLFVTCVGIIPIGSLVMLDTNELAVVLKPAADPADAEHPYVKIIADATGSAIENGRELDLHEKDETGDFLHNIIRLIDNTEYKFDTSRYFV
ncbi:MAG TPA: HD domain-containing phosphohydrolase [Nitrospiraceae bacterium]|nr:HD domain-containing phosphohydrolase [Nitrospiraceae bacterium]